MIFATCVDILKYKYSMYCTPVKDYRKIIRGTWLEYVIQ